MSYMAGIREFCVRSRTMEKPKYSRLMQLWKAGDPENTDNFYSDIDNPEIGRISKGIYEDQERLLSALDDVAFQAMVYRCKPYVSKKDNNAFRGWSQLITIMNEAKVYLILKRDGFIDIEFVDDSGPQKVPDLYARKGGKTVLVEVKTIWKSDEDIKRDRVWQAREGLTETFKQKLRVVYDSATVKFREYKVKADLNICYMLIHLDLQLSMVKENHSHLLEYLKSIEVDDIEIQPLLYP